MTRHLALKSILSDVPSRARDELMSFLEFSERDSAKNPGNAAAELLVTLAFFNANSLRPN